MRQSLELSAAEMDKTRLAPLLVPAEFLKTGRWCGPYTLLQTPDIGLTWCVLFPGDAMRYVDHAMQEFWEAEGTGWKALAMRNLAEHTDEERPATHALCRPNGELYGAAFMHDDGLGPSRLLLRDRIARLFPKGYRVALPERSCALAFSVDVDDREMSTLQEVIDGCYKKGTRPFVPGTYAADELRPHLLNS